MPKEVIVITQLPILVIKLVKSQLKFPSENMVFLKHFHGWNYIYDGLSNQKLQILTCIGLSILYI